MLTRRQEAWRSTCQSNLRQLGVAVLVYSTDWDGQYPWSLGSSKPENAWCDLGLLFDPGIIPISSVFFCPSSQDETFPFLVADDTASGPKPADDGELVVTLLTPTGFKPGNSRHVISYAYCFDARGEHPTAWTDKKALATTVLLLADKKAGITIEGDDLKQASHGGKGRNALYLDAHVDWIRGVDALDPEELDDQVGKPDADDYRAWWSDPPWYGERMQGNEARQEKAHR
jgi:prepilin-type processing-associated H-X9-DG protein